MRLGRENILIALGIMLAVMPWVGIPAEMKLRIVAVLGGLVALLSWSVRRRVVILKRKLHDRPS